MSSRKNADKLEVTTTPNTAMQIQKTTSTAKMHHHYYKRQYQTLIWDDV